MKPADTPTPVSLSILLRSAIRRAEAASDLALLPHAEVTARDEVLRVLSAACTALEGGDIYRASRLLICLIGQPMHDTLHDTCGAWINCTVYNWLCAHSTAWAVWAGEEKACIETPDGGTFEAPDLMAAQVLAMAPLGAALRNQPDALSPGHIYLCRVAATDEDGMLMPGCTRIRVDLAQA